MTFKITSENPPLSGVVSIVTGGAGAIGLAISLALHKAGATVVLTGRRAHALEKARATILESTSSLVAAPPISCVTSDVSDEDSVISLFARTKEMHGHVRLLVNCAGIAIGAPNTLELSGGDFRKTLDVNVLGMFLCSREAFHHMMTKSENGDEGGRIINVGSISSISPRPHSTAYTASKFAVEGLTQALSLDGRKHGIAVGVIHPGSVPSAMMSKEEIERRKVEEGGLLHANDVAHAVLSMATLPKGANVLGLTILPTAQPLVGRG